jgi:hypothetical protein
LEERLQRNVGVIPMPSAEPLHVQPSLTFTPPQLEMQ